MLVSHQCSPADEMNDFLGLGMKNVKKNDKYFSKTWLWVFGRRRAGSHFLFLNGASYRQEVRRPAVKQLHVFTNTLPLLRVNTRVTHSYGLCSCICVCVGPWAANGGPPVAASEAERGQRSVVGCQQSRRIRRNWVEEEICNNAL